ncbi:type II toxin-antitoxin system VapB family antitoxin [Rhizobacter sp. OV335]|uniref:type II toxin-antitoxin system VapB family antitoxin n=1 Tax=Rhizobacter sp. OV335 TaxID=1500264 RepID=UPI00091ADDE1|nr:type II toxin-antitoxin system VapB family antitoxin [Rhizobacter sp. OV335]SHN37802.1 antitoxin of type II TA system, VapB [Rhizobacter sp. OV335]
MRTRILIDDDLLQEALRATGAATTREVVELALRTLLRLDAQAQARQFKGKLVWEGNLDQMRADA